MSGVFFLSGVEYRANVMVWPAEILQRCVIWWPVPWERWKAPDPDPAPGTRRCPSDCWPSAERSYRPEPHNCSPTTYCANNPARPIHWDWEYQHSDSLSEQNLKTYTHTDGEVWWGGLVCCLCEEDWGCVPSGAAMLYPLMPMISGARVRLQYLATARSRDTDSPMKA